MEKQETQQYMANNNDFLQNNILQLRLDTSELINRLQQFLSGFIIVPERGTDGKTRFVEQKIGMPLCNKRGTQHLVNYVSGIINPSVVQGNYEESQYYSHLDRIHASISRQLIVNYHDWEMSYNDLEMICEFIMNLIEPFLSRLKDNKERESYFATLRTQENSRVENGGGIKRFFGGAQQ